MVSAHIRKEIETVYGNEIRYPKDCEALAGKISQVTGSNISASTVKRLFGFIESASKPSQYTLDTIAIYLGHKSWDELKNSDEADTVGQSELSTREAQNSRKTKLNMRYVAIALVVVITLGFSFFRFLYPKGNAVLKYSSLTDMPAPSEGGRVVSVDRDLYYISGSTTLQPQNYCWRYNISSNLWETLSTLPTARVETAIALVNKKIYVFGGWLGDNEGMTDAAEVYDVENDLWKTLPKLPVKITCANAVSSGTDIYILGGTVGETTTHFFRFNAIDNTYQKLPLFGKTMMYSSMVIDRNKIYVMGGESYSYKELLKRRHNELYVFDLDRKEWTEKSSMPIAVTRSSAVLTGNKIHLFGGLEADFVIGSAGITNTHFIYNIHDDRWETGARLPFAMCAQQSANIDSKVLLFGGICDFPNSSAKVIALNADEN